jgi:hypothetical protein
MTVHTWSRRLRSPCFSNRLQLAGVRALRAPDSAKRDAFARGSAGALVVTNSTHHGVHATMAAMAKYDFFISHHQADAGAEASLLAETLRNEGYRVFLDVDTHQVGDLEQLTRRALEDSKGVIALVGSHFAERVRQDRDWVRIELEAAQRSGKKVLPIVLPKAESNLLELPESLAWFGRTRWITFDRTRVGALVDELTSAFAVRAHSRSGPGALYLVLMILLAALLGMAYVDGQRKESALELQRVKLEAEKELALELQRVKLEAEKERADRLQRELDRLNGQR